MSIILGVERNPPPLLKRRVLRGEIFPARQNFGGFFLAPPKKTAADHYPIVRCEKFFVKRQFEAKEKWSETMSPKPFGKLRARLY